MHALKAGQVQTPATQLSMVQKLPSLHEFVSSLTKTQPIAGLHESSVQGLWSSQRVEPLPAQTPPLHVSVMVQAFPSLHVVPFGALGFEHSPIAGLHVPAT